MSRLGGMIVLVGSASILPTSLRGTTSLHLTGRRQAGGRTGPATVLVIEAGSGLIARLFLDRAGLTLPLTATLHSRRGAVIHAVTGGLVSSACSRRGRRSTSRNAGRAPWGSRGQGTVVILLVGIAGAGGRRSFVANGANLRRRGEWSVRIRRGRAARGHTSVGCAGCSSGGTSGGWRQVTTATRPEGCIAATRATLVGGSRAISQLRQGMVGRIATGTGHLRRASGCARA